MTFISDPAAKNETIIVKLRKLLLKQCGINGINALNKYLQITQTSDKISKMNTRQLKQAFRDFIIDLTDSQVNEIIAMVDEEKKELVSPDDWISALRGAAPSKRMERSTTKNSVWFTRYI